MSFLINYLFTEHNPDHFVCEYEIFNLTCKADQIISVTSAMYGRQNNSICPHEGVQSNGSFCACDDSLDVVQRRCNGRQSCAIEASNNAFCGDPCSNIYKYLEIEYTCINGTYDCPDGCMRTDFKLYDFEFSKKTICSSESFRYNVALHLVRSD